LKAKRFTCKLFFVLLSLSFCIRAASAEPAPGREYLDTVRSYADYMIEHGRDRCGDEHSPLFSAALDRIPPMTGSFFPIDGIRETDRTLKGANPMHDQNLYQILYALTEITGDKKYARESDKALKWFFGRCQSPATGLMAWGEHIGWDFQCEAMCGLDKSHEFFRPWVLWDKVYELAPEAALKFARGLWDHQIHDHETGTYSRHARWSRHQTKTRYEFPRHGGFYIMTWAKAYGKTRDPVYIKAVETLVDMFNRQNSKQTGAIPCASDPKLAKIVWPDSNLSLAVDLTDAAGAFPEPLRKKMIDRAETTDRVYLSLGHDFSPRGIGFVQGARIDTLKTLTSGPWTHTKPWVTGYGKATDSRIANLCYLRYLQLAEGKSRRGYRALILGSAFRYLESLPNFEETIYPGPMGHVVLHMLATHEITGETKYLNRADYFARLAVSSFLSDASPLPMASSRHDHYEAITRADTMMMAFLKLWVVQHRHELNSKLIFNDR